MKPSRLAAVAALAFLGACTEKSATKEALPPLPATANAVLTNNQVLLSVTHNACTRDGHLFTLRNDISFPVRESADNRVTEEELRALESSYNNIFSPSRSRYIQVVAGAQSSASLRQAIERGSALTGLTPEPDMSRDELMKAMAAYNDSALKFTTAQEDFRIAAVKVLQGNVQSAFINMDIERFTLSPAPAPECKP